ncbi:MAG: hypothetical protein H6757_06620 [Candidatus Omnitrophica bacterium]|nr:hypothetical protein [Candidatus Omnitrophota bacterium]
MPLYYPIVSFCNGLIALLIGIYALKNSVRQKIYRSLAMFMIGVALWGIFYAMWQMQTEKEAALFYIRLTMLFCNYIPFGFLWFVRDVVEDRSTSVRPVYFLAPTFVGVFQFSPLMIKDVQPRLQFQYWPIPDLLMQIWIFIFTGIIAYCFILLFKTWARSTGIRRWQLRWVTLTTLFVWLGGLTNWFLWFDIPIPPVPNISVALFLMLLAYAMIRRNLFDIEAIADLIHETKLSAIGALTASMNHEIKNPLFVIKGKTESFLNALENNIYADDREALHKAKETLQTTQEQVNRAMRIMQDFSNFSKRQQDTHSGVKYARINEVIEKILPFIRYELEFDKIELKMDLLEPLSALAVEAGHLEEIFLNLILNACQAMKATGGKIKISASSQDGKGRIVVTDNGPGIPDEILKVLFEPFRTTKERGNGLGLYITKQLVERNNGQIRVESIPSKGTSFFLTFYIVKS